MKKGLKLLFLTFVLALASNLSAQVTTSSLSGKVVDEENEPVIGATVLAVHEPSGTSYGGVTNVDGRYTIQGMRTGGPYNIKVSYVGYQTSLFKGLYLELGNTFKQNATLQPSSELLNEVVVVANAKAAAGAGQNFSADKIENTPTISRNVYDIVKNTPMAMVSKSGGITFAGSNNRYNSFQIDGTVSNDVFGLAGTGTNGGQTSANPISMDAIQEIQVVIAPFDVRQSGFTGGGINAITKQGTNKFHASAYTYYTNQDMYGKYSAVKDYAKDKLGKQSNKTFGATFGGPIIKDKLFFFVSAERHKESYPASVYPGYTSKYLTEAHAKAAVDQYKKLTGIAEEYGKRDVDRQATSLLARIDWNINQNHKLAVRYQHNDSYDDNYSPNSSTYYFNNSGYRMNNKTNSFVAELNSHLGESYYNELRASATFVRDNREVPYAAANVYIKDNAAENEGVVMNMGTEYSSGANYLNQDIYTLEDNFSLYRGNHTLTFGTHNEMYRMKNLFIQAAYGAWYYNSLAEFLADNPYQFTYKYTDPSVTGGDLRYAPIIKAAQFGFYAQDKWDVTSNLNLTYGLRFDIPAMLNSPTTNATFNQYAVSKGWDVSVGKMPSVKLMISPRVGFRWNLDDDHSTLLRGGLGLFTGRVPFVWLSNAYTNTGIEQKGVTIKTSVPTMTQYADDPYAASQAGTSGNPDIVTVARNFRFPQAFRANLALERTLPGDVKLTLEGLYSKTLNNVFFENLALTDDGAKVYAISGVEASAATYYNSKNATDYYTVINLKNTNKGYTYSLSASLEKRFDFGLDLSASYTYGHAKSVNDGTSSVAYSNWKYNYSRNTNSKGEIGYSRFDVPHHVVAQASYTTPKYAKGLFSTTVSLIYNGFSGSRYSLTMSDAVDYNGDGYKNNNLLYIPTEAELSKMNFVDLKTKSGDVIMTPEEGRQAFAAWIAGDSYAKNHRGQYAERNSNLSPWEHEFNVHVAQDIFCIKDRGSKIQLTFDVINFANMLNKKWGATYVSAFNVAPLGIAGVTKGSDGNYAPSFTYNSNNTVSKSDTGSRWHAQVGVKLIF